MLGAARPHSVLPSPWSCSGCGAPLNLRTWAVGVARACWGGALGVLPAGLRRVRLVYWVLGLRLRWMGPSPRWLVRSVGNCCSRTVHVESILRAPCKFPMLALGCYPPTGHHFVLLPTTSIAPWPSVLHSERVGNALHPTRSLWRQLNFSPACHSGPTG